MDNKSDPQTDKAFDLVIPIARVVGLAMVVSGTAIALGFGSVFTPEIGIFIAVMGLIEFFLTPTILRRAMNRKRDDFLAGRDPGNRPRQ